MDPRLSLGPGAVLALESSDYLYGTGLLALRVVQVGADPGQYRQLEWLRAGIAVTYRSGSQGYLWAATGEPEPTPHPLGEPPSFRFRAAHLLKFALALLDAARPEPFTNWEPVAFADVGLKPSEPRRRA